MIAFVKGYLEEIGDGICVIDVNGVGFNIYISPQTQSLLPPIGEEIKLHTYTAVREDAFLLYGFLNREELNLFKKLITVNGVGPKAGLSILSLGMAEDIRFSILSGDIKRISSASGVGKKTAERIILELKDKLEWDAGLISKESKRNNLASEIDSDEPRKQECLAALTVLGYSPTEGRRALSEIEITPTLSSEDILKEALRRML